MFSGMTPEYRRFSRGMSLALGGVARFALLLACVVAGSTACGVAGPRPASFPTDDDGGRASRLDRASARALPPGLGRVALSDRAGLGAWAWPDGRIRVTAALVDLLDDAELAAALAHEAGHLRAGAPGHEPTAVVGQGCSLDAELAADRAGCALLAERGVEPEAMIRMLEKLAAGAALDLTARIAASRATCVR